jgi:SAM-dependent methyltransferase
MSTSSTCQPRGSIDRDMEEHYGEDLAFIHDNGFGEYALKSAPGLLEILTQCRTGDDLVVDLGCGSGIWAEQLRRADYRVIGIDISDSMVRLARRRVPDAEFRIGSLFQTEIPPCMAITSIGECLNYLFDSDNDNERLASFFGQVYRVLLPGGLLVFDIAEPGQVKRGAPLRGFSEGADWAVLVEKEEDQQRRILTRRIVSFRRVGTHYRRTIELHRLQLYKLREVARELSRVGFRVRTARRYGSFELPRAHVAFIASKPGK